MNRDLKLSFLQKGRLILILILMSPNQLTNVSTLRSHKVNRSIKFDCEKSSLAFQSDLVKL